MVKWAQARQFHLQKHCSGQPCKLRPWVQGRGSLWLSSPWWFWHQTPHLFWTRAGRTLGIVSQIYLPESQAKGAHEHILSSVNVSFRVGRRTTGSAWSPIWDTKVEADHNPGRATMAWEVMPDSWIFILALSGLLWGYRLVISVLLPSFAHLRELKVRLWGLVIQ